jgi:hypothetical protein
MAFKFFRGERKKFRVSHFLLSQKIDLNLCVSVISVLKNSTFLMFRTMETSNLVY